MQLNTIAGPDEFMAHIRSEHDLLTLVKSNLAKARAAFSALEWPPMREVDESQIVYINWSQKMIRCACGNCCLVQEQWSLAACIECGAVYRHFVFPPDWEEIKRILLLRPHAQNRNWNMPNRRRNPESVDELRAQNAQNGDPTL